MPPQKLISLVDKISNRATATAEDHHIPLRILTMQSDLVIEEPEISSFDPKTSNRSETLNSDTSHGEISTDVSRFNPYSTPANIVERTIETSYSSNLDSILFLGSDIESPIKNGKRIQKDIRIDQPCDANNDLAENGGRFTIPPPKYSNLYSISSHIEEVQSSEASCTEHQNMNQSPRDSLIPQTSEVENEIPPPSIQEQVEDMNSKDVNLDPTVTGDAEYSDSRVDESFTNGESSISNFPEKTKSIEYKPEQDEGENHFVNEKASNKDFKVRRRARQRRKQKLLVESTFTDDETSIENYGAVSTSRLGGLQERSHQAWKSRQRKNGIMRSKNDDELQSQKGSVVSFGVSDTIYHFDADIPKRHKRTNIEPEEMSLDRSLNSEYTKSLESEVEDVFKDILFIGSPHKSKPGRRKYRYKSENERKIVDRRSKAKKDKRAQALGSSTYEVDEKSKSVNDSQYSTEESTKYSRSKFETDTIGDETYSLGSTVSGESSGDSRTVETHRSEKDTGDDPLKKVLGLVEGGLSVMTSAIEYALGEEVEPQKRGNVTNDQRKGKNDYDLFETCGLNIREEKVEPVSTREIFSRTTTGVARKAVVDPTANDMNRFASDEGTRKHQRRIVQGPVTELVTDNENKPDRSILSLGSGGELVQLAMHAARTVHKLKAVEYDESIGIDMYNEVKKIHVTLGLPLGSKFIQRRCHLLFGQSFAYPHLSLVPFYKSHSYISRERW